MERIQELIDQLQLQHRQQASPSQLLLTLHMLQGELLKAQQKNGAFRSSKVAVTLPANMNLPADEPTDAPPVKQEAAPVKQEAPPPPPPPVALPKPVEAYVPPKPPVEEQKPEIKPQLPVQPEPEHKRYMPAFDQEPAPEVPTLMQHHNKRKEINEIVAHQKESLNDKLKQPKKEVAHSLKETPIKDLRKGIGINDRFSFVNELFRGDDAMYERSIKTINGFHALSEAEYWISRELKVKLGWSDQNDTVQHFYHLVKRRFA